MFSERWYDSRLFSCGAYIVGSNSLEGQLVNSRVPEIVIYLRTHLRMSFQRTALMGHVPFSSAGPL